MLTSSQSIIDCLPGLIGIKDKQSTYLYANKPLTKLFGYRRCNDVVGITDYDLKCPAAEIAPTFIQQDEFVLHSHNITSIDLHYYADDRLHMLITSKSKYYDKHQSLQGTLFHSTELSSNLLDKFCKLLSLNCEQSMRHHKIITGSFDIDRAERDCHLTKRESECLFFYLRGKSAKEISIIFNISDKTVWSHLESIKLKLNCRTRSELFELCMQDNGLFYSVPYTLLAMHH